ncbi:MAG: SCO family protein [Rickettsiaceae bacterium]|nr:SCO family protein [Rickettsiaceae bacterium]
MRQKEIRNISKIITIIASCIIVLGTYFILSDNSVDKKIKPVEAEVDIGGDFELTNLENLKESTQVYNNKYKLIYFGFTFCPDICPATLYLMSSVIEITDKYGIDIVPIFVTIDPKRDDIETLKSFLSHFNSKIIGYTGTEEEIRKVADLYKVFFAKAPKKPEDKDYEEDYMMDHSSFLYLISPDAKYAKHFPSSASAEEIANYIHKLVSKDK